LFSNFQLVVSVSFASKLRFLLAVAFITLLVDPCLVVGRRVLDQSQTVLLQIS
jgi:hypothetical protein